jgi:hypothetical protein
MEILRKWHRSRHQWVDGTKEPAFGDAIDRRKFVVEPNACPMRATSEESVRSCASHELNEAATDVLNALGVQGVFDECGSVILVLLAIPTSRGLRNR